MRGGGSKVVTETDEIGGDEAGTTGWGAVVASEGRRLFKRLDRRGVTLSEVGSSQDISLEVGEDAGMEEEGTDLR